MRTMGTKALLALLCSLTVLTPIVLYTDTVSNESSTVLNGVFNEEVSSLGSIVELGERRALSE
ncbi:hypothetical protein HPP92_026416, partial [Vanilla planifolia]